MNQTAESENGTGAEARKLLAHLKGHEDKFPHKTAVQFPHVIAKLAEFWPNPALLRPYVQQLLLTRREARAGFPLDVYNEIDALNEVYDVLYPLTKKAKDNFWTWV
jgi:hypothetical protein